jgi:hypothetical protein
MRRHFALKARKPSIVENALTQQPLPLAHGALVRGRRRTVLRGARQRQSIEKPEPIAGWT